MFDDILLKKRKLDYNLVNFSLIENINTVNYDLKQHESI